MAVRVAINGFGRIGRLVLRGIMESRRNDIEVVAINDLGSVDMNAHLFRYDSTHGPFPGDVKVDGDTIDVGAGPIKVTAERNPADLPWGELGVDIAMECTGLFIDRESAGKHHAFLHSSRGNTQPGHVRPALWDPRLLLMMRERVTFL